MSAMNECANEKSLLHHSLNPHISGRQATAHEGLTGTRAGTVGSHDGHDQLADPEFLVVETALEVTAYALTDR